MGKIKEYFIFLLLFSVLLAYSYVSFFEWDAWLDFLDIIEKNNPIFYNLLCTSFFTFTSLLCIEDILYGIPKNKDYFFFGLGAAGTLFYGTQLVKLLF